MKKIIPFSGKMVKHERQQWLTALQEQMPQYSIVHLDELGPEEKADVEVVVVANPDVNKLMELNQLKWVHSVWAGVEGLVNSELNSRINISRLVDPNLSEAMSEATLAATLYIHREMPLYKSQQSRGEWRQHTVALAGQRQIGILGLGELGMQVARRLSLNGFIINGWSRQSKESQDKKITALSGPDGLETLLKTSEILIILLPLTAHTNNLIDHQAMALMPAGASVINFARGPILNQTALLSHLNSGHISHAVLDVFDQEPLPKHHPFWAHKDITIWPHIAAPTNRGTAAKVVANNLASYFESAHMADLVNRDQQY